MREWRKQTVTAPDHARTLTRGSGKGPPAAQPQVHASLGTAGALLRTLRGRRMRTDAEGHVGIQLEHRQIRKSAAAAIASNLRRLGPRVLPMSEMVRPHAGFQDFTKPQLACPCLRWCAHMQGCVLA